MFPLWTLALALFWNAHAFCGFYVSGADASLYNNATLVVMMRSGTRTVLSMQNNYEGPPEDFAMVIPVPEVLQKDRVKTLPPEIFQRVDSLAAPRLVEYWEQDPCMPLPPPMMMVPGAAVSYGAAGNGHPKSNLGVTIEAQFAVAEYDIVILSAKDSSGLDTWLRQEKYNIPAGAETVLRGYVQAGTKFFVARVDAERVTFRDGRAVLSPLRFHYDSPDFSLPVRLGLLNSQGEQDLLVHILAINQRYEVANYANAVIPTNIKVLDSVRQGFGDFYDALFVRASGTEPTVVTEYAWSAGSCDPCPTEPLNAMEILQLGGDVIPTMDPYRAVLTRLHFRYTRDTLAQDLVFLEADPIFGGRGTPDTSGNMREQAPSVSTENNFQGRYVILHPWEGEVNCPQPRRGLWGGPNGGSSNSASSAPSRLAGGAPAQPVALSAALAEDVPALGLVRSALAAEERAKAPAASPPSALEEAPAAPSPLDEEALQEDSLSPCSAINPRAGGLLLLLGLALAWTRRAQA